MSTDHDDRKRIKPPEKNHPDDKVRTVVEAALGVVPGGGSIAKLAADLIPTQAQKARSKWEGAISERTNVNTERLDQHAQVLAPTITLTGASVDLAVALARAPGDGMAGRGLTLVPVPYDQAGNSERPWERPAVSR